MSEISYYCLAPPDSEGKLAVWDHSMHFERVICRVQEAHRRSGRRIGNLAIKVKSPTFDDFVWTWYTECLIQDRLHKLFQGAGFTGYETRPVRSVLHKGTAIQSPKLLELVVTGWAGIASAESGIKIDRVDKCCDHVHYSPLITPQKLVDWKAWDGSDFFMVWPLPRFMFVTDRVIQLLRLHEIKGYTVRNLDTLLGGDGFTPGRLSYYMPEARAKEIGEPLGIY